MRLPVNLSKRGRCRVLPVAVGCACGITSIAQAQCTEGCNAIHTFTGENVGDQFGWVSNSMGDLNNDGVQDCVISATTFVATSATGKIYVYSGKTGTLMWSKSAEPGVQRLGYDVANAGDVTGDGINDVIAGAPFGSGPRAILYDGTNGQFVHEIIG